ncbi:hypothetical protein PMAYCL1PPCAC_24678 [Pristionchus mayeri]|uniref:Uncharacterized protein n=1 Tax=Pristionchus mayeri TaxID=1317129 RepID=A0AAN5D0J3_9BILA|nr:hypothetical protein PMAYCL1PPCAC_24678 [Pristionchus mayeri]
MLFAVHEIRQRREMSMAYSSHWVGRLRRFAVQWRVFDLIVDGIFNVDRVDIHQRWTGDGKIEVSDDRTHAEESDRSSEETTRYQENVVAVCHSHFLH